MTYFSPTHQMLMDGYTNLLGRILVSPPPPPTFLNFSSRSPKNSETITVQDSNSQTKTHSCSYKSRLSNVLVGNPGEKLIVRSIYIGRKKGSKNETVTWYYHDKINVQPFEALTIFLRPKLF